MNIKDEAGTDNVNHPPHYNQGSIEPIDVIEDWNLGFNLGNALKYIARAPHKGDHYGDLRKALWYLRRECIRITKGSSESELSSND